MTSNQINCRVIRPSPQACEDGSDVVIGSPSQDRLRSRGPSWRAVQSLWASSAFTSPAATPRLTKRSAQAPPRGYGRGATSPHHTREPSIKTTSSGPRLPAIRALQPRPRSAASTCRHSDEGFRGPLTRPLRRRPFCRAPLLGGGIPQLATRRLGMHVPGGTGCLGDYLGQPFGTALDSEYKKAALPAAGIHSRVMRITQIRVGRAQVPLSACLTASSRLGCHCSARGAHRNRHV